MKTRDLIGFQRGNGSIPSQHKLDTLYLKDQCLEGHNPQGPVYTTSKPNVKMTKLWSHQHKGIGKVMTDLKELEQAINEPDGVLVPTETRLEHHIPDVWEAIPIKTWGLPDPKMPKPLTPPPPSRTEEQEHAMKHWSFC